MFIRVKKIKAKKYAYLVENNWQATEKRWQITETEPKISLLMPEQNIRQTNNKKEKSSRQKVIKYLGRVYEFELPRREYNQKMVLDYKENIKRIIRWHLEQYGFKKIRNSMVENELELDLDTLNLKNSKTNADVLIKSYEGYIYSHSLKELHDFDGLGYDEEVGKQLAKKLVKAGMNMSKESFIHLFETTFKEAK